MTYNEQSMFLGSVIRAEKIKVRNINKTADNSRKKSSYSYWIDNLNICKSTVLDTFGIRDSRLRTIKLKINTGDVTLKDRRGTHSNRPRMISQDIRNLIADHIHSFVPREFSHLIHQRSTIICLGEDLNLTKMYRLFVEKYPDVKVGDTVYSEIFKTLNLRFEKPR